jgi:hypothetical protein
MVHFDFELGLFRRAVDFLHAHSHLLNFRFFREKQALALALALAFQKAS